MKPDRCLENCPDFFAATERDTAPKDRATFGDTDDLVEQLNDKEVELDTVPAVGVEAVGVLFHVFIFPIHAVRAERQAKTPTQQTAANRVQRN